MNRAEAMAKARASRGALPSKAAGVVRATKAITWVYRWGWSSSKILEIVGGSVNSGLANRLVRRGFLSARNTESGASGYVPAKFLTLTENGLNIAERDVKDPGLFLEYQLKPERLDQSKFRHDAIAQTATAKNLKAGLIVDYITEKMGAKFSEEYVKQHDVIWVNEDGEREGIEVELNKKYSYKLDGFIHSCIQSIQSGRVSQVLIVTDIRAIQKDYEQAFEVGAKYGHWKKEEGEIKLRKVGIRTVPDFMKGRVSCQLLDLSNDL